MPQTAAASAKIKELQVENSPKPTHAGVEFPRYFTARLEAGKTPYDEVQWETRNATIGNDKGAILFEQRDIEVPATGRRPRPTSSPANISTARLGSPERERSVAELVHRVVDTIADWGLADGYFATPERWRKLPQRTGAHDAAPEGGVQFAGLVQRRREGIARLRLVLRHRRRPIRKMTNEARPQCSACFIVSVKDSLESILDLAKTEGMLFKWGSGTGSNLSALREEDAILSGGGRASRPALLHEGLRRLRRA